MNKVLFKYKNILAIFAAMSFIAGCNSTDTAKTLDVQSDAEMATLNAVVQGKCPKTSFRDGTTFFRKYLKRGDGDPSKITYQASLAETTRSCTVSGDQLTVNVFAAGRVLAGPAGKAGDIELPIRVAVVDKTTNSVLYSQLSAQVVTLAEPELTSQFLFNNPSVTIPVGAGGETIVYVGFDDGPKK